MYWSKWVRCILGELVLQSRVPELVDSADLAEYSESVGVVEEAQEP
jgi:hypothetical protein